MSQCTKTTRAETTCRLITPGGVGAIAVIRVSGPESWESVRKCIRGRGGALSAVPHIDHASYGDFVDGDEVIDDVIVAARPAPDSEHPDVDICCHGSRRVVERILLALQAVGVHVATDSWQLTHVPSWQQFIELLADQCLAKATTQRGALYLLAQRTHLPTRLAEIIERIDAGEHDSARQLLCKLLDASCAAHRFHQPADVVVVGAPNAGKSSLINRLGGRDGAIVSDRPGTTRDWVSVTTAIDGVPITLIDTAGIHGAGDELEQQAIAAGRDRAASTDLTVLVVDGSLDSHEESIVDAIHPPPNDARILVINKSDIEISQATKRLQADAHFPVVVTSASTGDGIEQLRDVILESLGVGQRADFDLEPTVFDPGLRSRIGRLREEMDEDSSLSVAGLVAAILDD